MVAMKTYQFDPSDVAVVSEILPEVEVFHELENEGKWVLLGGIDPDELHHAFVGETSACRCFMAKPLSVGFR